MPELHKLEHALMEVLGPGFEDALRSLVEHERWYTTGIVVKDLFDFWVRDRLEAALDDTWVFECLRAHERKFLCERVGIDRAALIGKTPTEVAGAVLDACAIPHARPKSAREFAESCRALAELVEDDDHHVAVSARQKAERALRIMLFFHTYTLCAADFTDLIDNPGEVRLPRRLEKLKSANLHTSAEHLCGALQEDGWADLGFLTLATRKLSKRLEERAARSISGGLLTLFSSKEADSFLALGTALQAYTHDRPSADTNKKQALRAAMDEVARSIQSMVERTAFPDEVVVREVCDGIFGTVIHVANSAGAELRLSVEKRPTVGQKLFIQRATSRPYARCEWSPCPW
ncbi:MAG: hypothetical protein ACT4TC_05165 [Myxococcaceae bacterium]